MSNEPTHWENELGERRPVPPRKRRLKPTLLRGDHELREFVFRRSGFACTWCRKPNDTVTTVDHIVPLSGGGSHHPDNLQTLCQTCNAKKSNTWDKPLGAAFRRGLESESAP